MTHNFTLQLATRPPFVPQLTAVAQSIIVVDVVSTRLANRTK